MARSYASPTYALPTTGRGYGFRPRGRISPFFDCVTEAGGKNYHQHFNSYIAYELGDDLAGQYRALRETATLVDVSVLRMIQIRGPDARAFADYLTTRNIMKMTPGRSSYVFVCNAAGMVIADPVLLFIDEETIWLSISTTHLELWVEGVLVNSGFNVTISSPPAPPVQVSGPKARDILQGLTDHPLDQLKPYRCVRCRLAGFDVILSTTGYSGELSYEVYLLGAEPYPKGRQSANQLWRAIVAAGAPMGLRESPVLASRATEAGFIAISIGEGDRIYATEFWRPSIVDFTGSDFIGKPALLHMRDCGGPPRAMVGLETVNEGERLELGEWDMPIYDGDEVVGDTRRVAFSQTCNRGISIAMINRDFAQVGRKLVLPHGGGVSQVQIVKLPFVRSA